MWELLKVCVCVWWDSYQQCPIETQSHDGFMISFHKAKHETETCENMPWKTLRVQRSRDVPRHAHVNTKALQCVFFARHYGRSGPETSLQFFNASDHRHNIKQLVQPQGSKVRLRLLMAELKRWSARCHTEDREWMEERQ